MTSSAARAIRGVAAVCAIALAIDPVFAQTSDLYFSEYVEGSGNNKALELHNGSAAPIDLAAGAYNVQIFFNGAVAAGLTIPLAGTVPAGAVFVLAHASASAAILAEADQTNAAGWFNGDDAIVLRRGEVVLDIIGQVGLDPGAEWGTGEVSTADNTLRRRAGVTQGDVNPSDAFTPATEWDGFSTDTVDGLGCRLGVCTPPPPPPLTCGAPFERIFNIQGRSAAAAITGPVQTEGVVVGDYEEPSGSGQLRGFYLQDADGDGDVTTSDGIFVFNDRRSVQPGDRVRVRGDAGEFQGQTQIAAADVAVCGTGSVAPVDVLLPVPAADYFERFEGMLVRLPQTLFVTEHFQLGRFGQVVMSSGARLRQPTDVLPPGSEAAALQAANSLNRILIDDGTNVQNPDPIVFGRDGQPLSAANTLRGGDTATGTVGVMTFTWAGNAASGNAYRVRPVGALGGQVAFAAANPRPAAAPALSGRIRVASMNLLNYFNTFAGCTAGAGGAPTDCRGAESQAEFDRQRAKTIAAIAGTGAHIVGLIELENDGYGAGSAIRSLVDALNQPDATARWALIDADALTGEANALGVDAIKVGLIYRADAVIPVGTTAALNDEAFVNAGDAVARNRPALAQAFEEVATGARFIVSVNHLKSKGSACDAPDAGDGQGACSEVRRIAAERLAAWLAADPTGTGDPDVLIVGDLNAYRRETAVQMLVDAGYVNAIDALSGPAEYSYVFDGQWGSLDHALVSPTLAEQVRAAVHFHINADEPSVLDYNVNFKNAGQVSGLYAPDMYRIADHDPVLVDLSPTVSADSGGHMTVAGYLLLGSSGSPARASRRTVHVVATAAPASTDEEHPRGQLLVHLSGGSAAADYAIRGGAPTSFQLFGGARHAVAVWRAAIYESSRRGPAPIVASDAIVRIAASDGRDADAVGITVWTSDGALWFSSAGDGVYADERPLDGGAVVIR